MKKCTKCLVYKSPPEFLSRKEGKDKLTSWCRKCCGVNAARWKSSNRDKWSYYMISYRKKNQLRLDAQTKEWRIKNKELVSKTSAVWRVANREKRSLYYSAWQKANSAKCQARNKAREAARLKATPFWANQFFIEEAYDLAARRTSLKTGGHDEWNVDHIVPLKSKIVCGFHVHNNIQVIPASMNKSKGNRFWPDMPC